MIRSVLFDFNGVLVDDEPVHFRLFRDLLESFEIPLTEPEFRSEYLGLDDRSSLEKALSRAGRRLAPEEILRLLEAKGRRYLEWVENDLTACVGAVAAVHAVAERFPAAVCSGAGRAEIELVLNRLNLREHFAVIVSADDIARSKPDPEGYFLALDALRDESCLGLEAGQCLAIEDSRNGVIAAKSAGMWVVGVTHSIDETALRQAGADAILHDLNWLNPDWIQGFFHPEISP